MKAIETIYKGYRFRSRLEARWAVFFDTLKIKWEYEPEGYQAPDGTRYLPDFFLPGFHEGKGIYVEVKGCDSFDEKLFAKPIAMAKQGFGMVLCLYGPPCNRTFVLVDTAYDGDDDDVGENGGPSFFSTPADRRDRPIIGWHYIPVSFHAKYLPGGRDGDEYRLWFGWGKLGDDFAGIDHAVNASRGARFEFGQSGAGK